MLVRIPSEAVIFSGDEIQLWINRISDTGLNKTVSLFMKGHYIPLNEQCGVVFHNLNWYVDTFFEEESVSVTLNTYFLAVPNTSDCWRR